MACNEHEKIIAFDTLFTNNHIQMLKVILPYMDNQTQKFMAIYIKFLELSYTIDFFKKHPFPLCGCVKQESFSDMPKLCNELLPFCSDQEKKHLEQMQGIFKGMEMYREMSKTMETMKEFMPDMGDMFQNMQAASFPDLSALAGAFSGNFANGLDSDFLSSFLDHSVGNTAVDHTASAHNSYDQEASTQESSDQETPDQGTQSNAGFDNMMGMLMNMMTPEQKEMYEMFKGDNKNAE